MLRISLLLLATLSVFRLNAQNTLIKKSGKTIEYTSHDWDDLTFTIKTKGGKILIPIDSILGYYAKKDEVIYHCVTVIGKKGGKDIDFMRQLLYGDKGDRKIDFMKQTLYGDIGVYEDITTSSTMMTTAAAPGTGGPTTTMAPTKTTDLYLGKQGYLQYFGYPKIFAREGKKKILKDFLTDSSFTQRINSEKFIITYDTAMDLIRENNLAKFILPDDSGPKTTAFFYWRERKEPGKTAKLIINDATTYDINPGQVAPVMLLAAQLSKFCITSGTQTFCDLIEGNPAGIDYIEVKIKSKKISWEHVKSKNANFYLQHPDRD